MSVGDGILILPFTSEIWQSVAQNKKGVFELFDLTID